MNDYEVNMVALVILRLITGGSAFSGALCIYITILTEGSWWNELFNITNIEK